MQIPMLLSWIKTDTDVALLDQKRQQKLDQQDRRKRKIREDLSYLNSNRLSFLRSGVYTPELFLEEQSKLNSELTLLQLEEQASDESMHELIKEIVKLSELLKNGAMYWDYANSREKEKIIRVIFSELRVSGNSFEYQCKKGFQALESRFISIGDPIGIRTRVPGLRILCPDQTRR